MKKLKIFILTRREKIEAIEDKIDIKDYSNVEVINAKGRLVTPGFIEPHCHMGVYETGIREGMDGNESTNPVTPSVKGNRRN